MSAPALRSSYRNAPLSSLDTRSTQKRFRRVGGQSNSASTVSDDSSSFVRSIILTGHWLTEQREKLLSGLCIILLILSISFFSVSLSKTNTLLISNAGDAQNVAYATLGYTQLCFTPQYYASDNVTLIVLNQECTVSSITSQCNFQLSSFAQSFQRQNYGRVDSALTGCTEFRAVYVCHILGLIFAVLSLFFMLLAHLRLNWLVSRLWSHPTKVSALLTSFASGSFGVMAQCLLIDWMNYNQKNLVSFAYSSFASGAGTTLTTVVLGQTAFYEVGGWVCSLTAFVCYIAHFPSALAK